jgi:hypothetical protein
VVKVVVGVAVLAVMHHFVVVLVVFLVEAEAEAEVLGDLALILQEQVELVDQVVL